MRKPTVPCRGCTPETGRSASPNCHATCEKYQIYKKDLEKWRETVREKKEEYYAWVQDEGRK